MLSRRAVTFATTLCRRYSTSQALKPVPLLQDNTTSTFRREAFDPGTPTLLPPKSFIALPAVRKWFSNEPDGKTVLNSSYLHRFDSTIVPLEFSLENYFSRSNQPLGLFLDASTSATSNARVYLAQAPIPDLPQGLRDDVPTPDLVLKAGKGDVYDSSIWLGNAPTYTPLHRDPNPNLFVQLAGRKVVRLFRPDVGRGIFARVQEKIGGEANEAMRGEEMMAGAEKKALEDEVWGTDGDFGGGASVQDAWEAELSAGDGLFIPKGWWHSVKSTGEGMTGSVNWWFR